MPRHARPSLLLALLMLALTLPAAQAATFTGAPVLTGTAHPSTTAEPWTGVSLTWTATSAALGYQVWRKGPLDADFGVLPPATGTTDLFYADSSVQPSTTYAYYVVPMTQLQVYLPSNVVNVTSPAVPPADTAAPVVTISSPVSGTRVSGTVRVSASSTDNVGVVAMDMRTASGTLLVYTAGPSFTYDWNTKGLKKGSTQKLTVRAFDLAGNVGSATVTVTIK